MSIQEQYFKEIASAIRAKGGTTSNIAAKDFAKAIRNLPESGSGGGGGGGGGVSSDNAIGVSYDEIIFEASPVKLTNITIIEEAT